MNVLNGSPPGGNRCNHDPHNPQLSPPEAIRKGAGGLPRILSLAAERAKEWFFHPDKCPPLQSHPDRQTRSERREACQVVLEALLSRLDLSSLCVGTPTSAAGFIDVDMKSIVRISGLGQRRCERAIGQLKEAGFITVKQQPTPLDLEIKRAWNRQLCEYFRQGLETREAQRLVNEKFGFPVSWSPGRVHPNCPERAGIYFKLSPKGRFFPTEVHKVT